MENGIGYEPTFNNSAQIGVDHYENFDIVSNPLANVEFQSHKESIINFLKEQDEERSLFFYPNGNNPKFFIKKRGNASAEDIEIIRENDYIADDLYNFNKQGMYAFNSLNNEIKMAPRITEIINSEEVQNLFKARGFTKLVFVPPIGGIVDRKNKSKYMVYESLSAWPGLQFSHVMEKDNYEVVKELRRIFIKNHIEPNDFNQNQLLVDRNEPGVIYLIDTEGYTPLKSWED